MRTGKGMPSATHAAITRARKGMATAKARMTKKQALRAEDARRRARLEEQKKSGRNGKELGLTRQPTI